MTLTLGQLPCPFASGAVTTPLTVVPLDQGETNVFTEPAEEPQTSALTLYHDGPHPPRLLVPQRAPKWRIPFTQDRPEAKVDFARLACLDTVWDICSMLDPDSFPDELIETLEEIYSYLAKPFADERVREQAIALTAGFMDILLLDEMAAGDQDWVYRTPYGRQDGIVFNGFSRLILPRHEAGAVFQSFREKARRCLNSLEEIAGCQGENMFYLGEPIPWSRAGETEMSLEKLLRGRKSRMELVVGIDYGAAIMFSGHLFTPPSEGANEKMATVTPFATNNLLMPATPIPRQDFWSAMLRSGLSPTPTSNDGFLSLGESPSSAEEIVSRMKRRLFRRPEEVEKRRKLRRLAVLVRNAGNPGALARLESGHISHYESLMAVEGIKPGVILTRSGTSANETAVCGVARMAIGSKAYCHEGWYYENARSVMRYFDEAKGVDDATCCFVNLIPCYPETLLKLDSKAGSSYLNPRETIDRFISKAKAHPQERHFLVIDKTSDLLFSIPPSSIPRNLEVVETASLSKHQRGARNYFYGMVVSRGSDLMGEVLRTERGNQMASLTPFGIVNLPRLTATEIRERREHLLNLNRIFAENFDEMQGGVAEEFRSRTEIQDGFVYIIPPIEAVIRQLDQFSKDGVLPGRKLFHKAVGSQDYSKVRMPHVMAYGMLEPSAKQSLKKMGIHIADSFGLKDTRAISVCYDFRNRWQRKVAGASDDMIFSAQSLRISIGTDETEDSIEYKALALSSLMAANMGMYLWQQKLLPR